MAVDQILMTVSELLKRLHWGGVGTEDIGYTLPLQPVDRLKEIPGSTIIDAVGGKIGYRIPVAEGGLSVFGDIYIESDCRQSMTNVFGFLHKQGIKALRG